MKERWNKIKSIFDIRKGEKEEKRDFEKLYHNIPNEELKSRIGATGNWYIERATRCKRWFYFLEIVSIILPLLTTFLNGCQNNNIAVTVCALLTALVTSVLSFTKCREKWTLYRTTIEQIKRELTLFWVDKPNDEKMKELSERLEGIMAQEHKVWIRYAKEQNGQEKREQEENRD